MLYIRTSCQFTRNLCKKEAFVNPKYYNKGRPVYFPYSYKASLINN